MRRPITRASYLALIIPLFISACRGYSRHPIDPLPQEEIDRRLLGKWRPLEDPDPDNYILVLAGDNEVTKRAFSKLHKDLGYWKDASLTCKTCFYAVTYFNHHGTNPYLQNWSAFLSNVKGHTFLNQSYRDTARNKSDENGFLLAHVSSISPNADTVTLSIVGDPQVTNLPASLMVRHYLEQNLTNPMLYSRTLHFVRLKNDGE